jgi:hypothetical protein
VATIFPEGVKYYPRRYFPSFKFCANGFVDDTDDGQTLSAVSYWELLDATNLTEGDTLG